MAVPAEWTGQRGRALLAGSLRMNKMAVSSESYGGLLCQQHWQMDPRRLHLAQRTIYYLRQFSVLDLDRVHSINVKSQTEHAMRQLMDEIYDSQIGVHPKSKRFLDQMQSWSARMTMTPGDGSADNQTE